MRKIVILILIFFVGSELYSQNKVIVGNVKYTTELQYNFNENYNFVNLLALNIQLSTEAMGVWRNGFLDMELISIYRTSKDRILDDWQTFSNIDERSQWFRIFTLGYTHKIHKVDLFFGLRSVNVDYFTAPYTSLFTNSSCGIYPTISANYPLANYPLSAPCMHAEYEIDNNWSVKNSLYNGVAYESLKESFTIDPKRDGIFNMTQVSYAHNSKYYGIYSLGSAVQTKMRRNTAYSFWADIEQCVYSNNGREIGVLAQCSFAPSGENLCSDYYGVGLIFNGWTTNSKSDQLGVWVNKTKFDNKNEIALELTWKCQIMKNLDIQPAFHLIRNSGRMMAAGLFRLSYQFDFSR